MGRVLLDQLIIDTLSAVSVSVDSVHVENQELKKPVHMLLVFDD